MRLRNVPGARETIIENQFSIQQPEQMKGKWAEVFKNEHLLPKVDGILISKTRYKIPDEHGFVIELDVFHGEYEGLVMAEVEFPSEEVAVEYEGPEWFDDEVTFDSRYQNNNLANK